MRRIPELDALRGIAAIVVVVFHLRFLNSFPLMGTAVDLFFVLSGYLITTIILRAGDDSRRFYGRFYARRSLRIWPIYYLYIGVALVVNRFLTDPQPGACVPYLLTYTQYIQHYWFGEGPRFSVLFLHTWTLAIEEQFYLVWPLLVRLAGRKRLVFVILPLLVLPMLMRTWGFHWALLATRSEGLTLGALLATLTLDRDRFERRRGALGWAFAGVIAAALSYPSWRSPLIATAMRAWPGQSWHMIPASINTFRICLFHFGVVGLVLTLQGRPILAMLRDVRLCYLGKISYGLYLYHPLVLAAVSLSGKALGVRRVPFMSPLCLSLTIGVAALSWRFIERPILALKDRFAYDGERPHARDEPAPTVAGSAAPHFELGSPGASPVGEPSRGTAAGLQVRVPKGDAAC